MNYRYSISVELTYLENERLLNVYYITQQKKYISSLYIFMFCFYDVVFKSCS